MTAALFSSNLLSWALQAAVVIAAGGMISRLLKMRPRAKYFYLQAVLFVCLLLPFIRPWKRPGIEGIVVSTSVRTDFRPVTPTPFPFSGSQLILIGIGLGIGVRAALLGLGFRRLRRYRLHSIALTPASSWAVEADIRVSREVRGPVTFGFRRPVILLPADFPALGEPVRDAILCHEILHVQRADWLFTLAEEALRAVFWFHPAMWWLLSEIQLAREQTVDLEAISMTAGREPYVDALLAVVGFNTAPAPLFLRRRHLKRRVFSILKEVKVSKAHTLATLTVATAALISSAWMVGGAIPLQAAPQTQTSVESIHSISIMGVPEQQKLELLARLGHAGIRQGPVEQTSAELLQSIAQTIADGSGRQLVAQIRVAGPGEVDLVIGTPFALPVATSNLLRVGAELEAANSLSKVPPVYPGLAKAARVQGVVRLEIVIGKEGNVQNVRFLSGPPLLIQSAMDAVRHWTYRPTLLNGQPVEIVTTVDVNYTLAQ